MKKSTKFVALLLAVALVCSMSTVLAVEPEIEEAHIHDGDCCAAEAAIFEEIASPNACSHSHVYYRYESQERNVGGTNICYYVDTYVITYCTDCGVVLSRSLSNSVAYGHTGYPRCTRCNVVI